MMRRLETMIMPDDPSIFEGADALRRYQGTQAPGSPAQEVERCRILGRCGKSRSAAIDPK